MARCSTGIRFDSAVCSSSGQVNDETTSLSEVVSSLTCPELLQTAESNLMPVLQRAIAQQNFFTGANPNVLNRLFQEDPELKASIATLESPSPWLWNFFTRTY